MLRLHWRGVDLLLVDMDAAAPVFRDCMPQGVTPVSSTAFKGLAAPAGPHSDPRSVNSFSSWQYGRGGGEGGEAWCGSGAWAPTYLSWTCRRRDRGGGGCTQACERSVPRPGVVIA